MIYCPSSDTKSLYIHWPFCPYKCHFCPFVAIASHDQFMERYHRALCAEITRFFAQYEKNPAIETIFLGGGTPSTYPDHLILDMFGILKNMIQLCPSNEVTIEVNPGTVRKEQLPLWKSIGINRMSIGVQSLNDRVLQNLNRHQRAADVFALLDYARHYFDNISVDLILGLPHVSVAEWKALIEQVITWPISHVSIYFLTIHENTPLYFSVKTNKTQLPPDDEVIDLFYWTRERLLTADFAHYELSNFARNEQYSRHNTVYWERKPYKGFGLGACSFDGTLRLQNEKNLMNYIEAMEQERDATIFSETLTEDQIRLEKVMLGLRRSKGVHINELVQGLEGGRYDRFNQTLSWLIEKKFITREDSVLRLTAAGLAVENEVISQLLR